MKKDQNIDTVFGLAVIVILAAAVFVISNNTNIAKVNEQKDSQIAMGQVVQNKNFKIKILAAQLAAKQSELDSVKKELLGVKADLEAVSKKLTTIVAPAEPAVPAAAAAQ